MHDFKHCPICAAELNSTRIAHEGRDRLMCGACGYIFYLNPRVVCGTLPIENGKVWLLRRGIEPRYGFWTYPAGFQELDETSEDAAVRETLEELGIHVMVTGLHGVYSRAHSPVVNIVYVARLFPNSPRPTTTPEAVEVKLFSPGEIPWMDLAFESTARVLRHWVEPAIGV